MVWYGMVWYGMGPVKLKLTERQHLFFIMLIVNENVEDWIDMAAEDPTEEHLQPRHPRQPQPPQRLP